VSTVPSEEFVRRTCIAGTAMSELRARIGISQEMVSAQFLRPIVLPETGEYLFAVDLENLTARLVCARFSTAPSSGPSSSRR
jgi:hypothetical protein